MNEGEDLVIPAVPGQRKPVISQGWNCLVDAPELIERLNAVEAELGIAQADAKKMEAFMNRFESSIMNICRAISGINFHGESHEELSQATWEAKQLLYGPHNSMNLFLRERAVRIAQAAAKPDEPESAESTEVDPE